MSRFYERKSLDETEHDGVATLCNVPYEITVRLAGALPWHLKFTFTLRHSLYNLSADIVDRRSKSFVYDCDHHWFQLLLSVLSCICYLLMLISNYANSVYYRNCDNYFYWEMKLITNYHFVSEKRWIAVCFYQCRLILIPV